MLCDTYIKSIVAGAITYVRDVAATAELLRRDEVDAIEIHTSGR